MSDRPPSPPASGFGPGWAARFGVEDEGPAAVAEPVSASELAANLAARMCHDFISPASAIVSGIDLLDDPTAQDMREDAMALIGSSAKKLVAMLAFSRIAFGASANAESFDARELERLTRGVFEHVRAELDWAATPASLNKAAARALLNLAQIGGGVLPMGGVARTTAQEQGAEVLIAVDCTGSRVRLRPEVAAGLRGEPLSEGLTGHWVQAYYVHALVRAAGGSVDAVVAEDRVVLRARTPR